MIKFLGIIPGLALFRHAGAVAIILLSGDNVPTPRPPPRSEF